MPCGRNACLPPQTGAAPYSVFRPLSYPGDIKFPISMHTLQNCCRKGWRLGVGNHFATMRWSFSDVRAKTWPNFISLSDAVTGRVPDLRATWHGRCGDEGGTIECGLTARSERCPWSLGRLVQTERMPDLRRVPNLETLRLRNAAKLKFLPNASVLQSHAFDGPKSLWNVR